MTENQSSKAETLFGITVVTAGLGLVLFALFPLALPFLLLTGVALVPLLLPVLVLGLIAAVVATAVRAARALGGRASRRPSRHARPSGSPRPTRTAIAGAGKRG